MKVYALDNIDYDSEELSSIHNTLRTNLNVMFINFKEDFGLSGLDINLNTDEYIEEHIKAFTELSDVVRQVKDTHVVLINNYLLSFVLEVMSYDRRMGNNNLLEKISNNEQLDNLRKTDLTFFISKDENIDVLKNDLIQNILTDKIKIVKESIVNIVLQEIELDDLNFR